MSKHTAVLVVAVVLALGVVALGGSQKPSLTGSWQVDSHHSDAHLTSDGTTDYGKTKINITVGVGRVNGGLVFDDGDLTKSSVDLHIYPANSMAPPMDEMGKVLLSHWLADEANHTLLCFHSKKVVRTSDGRLQATGDLTVVRVDRNVYPPPPESYYGPVYGDPIIHRDTREATFVLDPPAADGSGQKDGGIEESISAKVFREDFPQMVKTVVSTYWPPVVQDKKCYVPSPSEAYSGAKCTGTFVESPSLPEAPHAGGGEDVGSRQNFNALVGERLNIAVHMRLLPRGSGEQMAGGN